MRSTAPQPVAPQTNGPMPQPIGSQLTAPLAAPLASSAPMPGIAGSPGPQPDSPMQFADAASGGTMSDGPSASPSAASSAGICASCGFQSPPGFAFCGRCGTPLATPAAAAPENVGSAQTIFVGDARDVAIAEPPPPPPMPQPMSPQPMSPQPMSPQPDGEQAAPPLGVAAPVVGSSGTAPGSQSPVPPIAPGVPVRLVMLGPDGQPIGERLLAGGEAIDVGREAGPPWDDDAYLDPKHATMRAAEAGVMIEDHHSLNGVFVKLTGRTELRNGDQFRVGQELLSYEELPEPTPTDDGTERMGSPNPGYWGRVSVLVDPAMAASAFAMSGEGLGIGREVVEITFPTDGYVSGRHCRIVGDDSGIFLEDLGSSNGTYMRVRTGQVLPFGSLVLIGQKLFQLERA